MAEFRMPSLGADMESGTLVQWLIKPGDHVNRGDVVAVVETQKGAIDVEIFETGLVSTLVVAEGSEVPVGTVLALLNGAGPVAVSAEPTPERPPLPSSTAPTTSPKVALEPVLPVTPGTAPRLHVSPLARRRAQELGVDLSTIKGTRPGGAISVADVENAAVEIARKQPLAGTVPQGTAGPDLAPGRVATQPASERQKAMRAAIATAMSRSNREIPHYYLGTEIDLKQSLDWLEAENARRQVTDRLLYAALVLKAVALATREVPEVNGFFTGEEFQPSEAVHVGVAISLRQGGLVAPAIHHTDLLNLDELMTKLRDLIMRARSGKLRSSEISDPTITVTNLGEQGVPIVYGVIYPPQVALVGFGKIVERPWATGGLMGVRPVMTATLAADHRVSDGHRGGIFLAAIERLLQEPEKL